MEKLLVMVFFLGLILWGFHVMKKINVFFRMRNREKGLPIDEEE